PVARGLAGKVQRGFVDPQIALHLDYLEAELGKSAWFGGDAFGVADIALSFPLEAAAARAGLDAGRPRLWALLERIHARPAYQRALERGGEYARGWIARGRNAAARFDGEGYRRRLARAAEDFVDETNYRYRRLRRQVNRHPVATVAIVAGTIGAFLLLRRVLRDSDED